MFFHLKIDTRATAKYLTADKMLLRVKSKMIQTLINVCKDVLLKFPSPVQQYLFENQNFQDRVSVKKKLKQPSLSYQQSCQTIRWRGGIKPIILNHNNLLESPRQKFEPNESSNTANSRCNSQIYLPSL